MQPRERPRRRAADLDAEVLSVQEITPAALQRLRPARIDELLPHAVVHPEGGAGGMALFTDVPLEQLAVPEGFWNEPAIGTARFPGAPPVEIWAVHPPAPSNGERASALRRDLRALPPAGDPLRILAGDFNATLDNGDLRDLIGTGYEDAAEQVGAGLSPTWPDGRRFPPQVTIDHVLVDARIGVHEVRVLDLPGSDHRPVFAEVVLPRA